MHSQRQICKFVLVGALFHAHVCGHHGDHHLENDDTPSPSYVRDSIVAARTDSAPRDGHRSSPFSATYK
jgi:hypothetical protein